jgi:hypothetical protein
VANDHTFRFDDVLHRIEPPDVVAGLRGRRIRVERRLNGTLAAALQGAPNSASRLQRTG